jgi:hypothetical protein
MPKRATITFSSDDAPTVDSEELHVYYCKWSGKHAITTNCDLRRAPRRRTDNSSVRESHARPLSTTALQAVVALVDSFSAQRRQASHCRPDEALMQP